MPSTPFWYLGERAMFRRLAARRLRDGSWTSAAESLVADLAREAPSEAPTLHLFFEARCAQACEFCEAPAVRDKPLPRVLSVLYRRLDPVTGDLVSSGAFEALLAACERHTPRVALSITGYDWMQHPGRDAILDALERHPDLSKRLQGPGTALSDPALARRVAALPGLRAVALTLQASDAAAHDAMVGREGSFREVRRAIEQLHEGGATVEISTVLTRDAVAHLPQTLTWLATRRWKTWLSAFMPDRDLPAPEALHPTLAQLRSALADHERAADAAVVSFVGVALCAVPARLRDRAVGAPPSDVGGAARASACDRCAMRDRCPGVSASYLRAHGDGDLIALGARRA